MAYYGENGKITIDEVAAQADIRRIEAAISSLNNSKKAIENLIQQASSEQGQTSTSVIEKATEMKKHIDEMIGRLSETASFISQTVSHYQLVDQKIKEAINASRTIAETVSAKPTPTATTIATASQPTNGIGDIAKKLFDELKKNGGKK